MKKLLIPVSLCLLSVSVYSQAWLKGGNNPSGNPFTLGSNSNDPIGFETNGIQRAIIRQGGLGVNAGQIAFGNNLPNGFNPANRLHLHQTGGNPGIRFSTDNTGSTAQDGFAFGNTNNGIAFFSQFENQPVFFGTGDGSGAVTKRMCLDPGGTNNTDGRLTIGNNLNFPPNPLDRLNLIETNLGGRNAIRFQNVNSGLTANDGYQTGIDNTTGFVFHTQHEYQPIVWETNDGTAGNVKEWTY